MILVCTSCAPITSYCTPQSGRFSSELANYTNRNVATKNIIKTIRPEFVLFGLDFSFFVGPKMCPDRRLFLFICWRGNDSRVPRANTLIFDSMVGDARRNEKPTKFVPYVRACNNKSDGKRQTYRPREPTSLCIFFRLCFMGDFGTAEVSLQCVFDKKDSI